MEINSGGDSNSRQNNHEPNGRDHNTHQCPGRQIIIIISSHPNPQGSLLPAVRKVIISCTHVIVHSCFGDFEHSQTPIRPTVIKFRQLSSSSSREIASPEVLSKVGQEFSSVRQSSMMEMFWIRTSEIVFSKFNKILTIRLLATLTIVVGRVCVRPSPLEVDVIVGSDGKIIGEEIILHTRENLDDVSTLPSHSERDNTFVDVRFGADSQTVASILEGTTKLSGVDGKLENQIAPEPNIDIRVVLEPVSVCDGS
mmetsp:Transcript_13787/g.21408  ORF Transcript_13787/g.21408 Transcript_13787/m.21408 type:complete len:254 (+) Transcript_13787:234-995(+)